MAYSLLDDRDWEEWERRRQEADQLGALLGSGPDIGPLPSMPPPNFESAQMAPLAEDPTAPDWTTAVSIGASGLGAIADLALNKGRNTGAILAAGAEGANRAADVRLRGQQEMMQYEQARARQAMEQQQLAERARYNDYLERAMLQREGSQARTAGLRERGLELAEDRIEQGETRLEQSGERNKIASRRLDMQGDLDLAEDKAGAQARGRITATNALAGETAEAKRREYEALTPAHVARAEQTAQATADEKAALAGAQAQARESVTGSAEARAEKGQQDRLNKFRADTQFSRKLAGTAAELEKLISKYPGDKPGTGMWDSFKSGKLSSDDDLRVRAFIADMNDLMKRDRTGMAITKAEDEAIAQFTSGGTGATEQQFRIAFEALRNSIKRELTQQAYGRENEARGILGPYGDWALGVRAPAQPGITSFDGLQNERLPVTNQKRSQVPRVDDVIRLGPTGPGAPGSVNMPAAAPSGGGMMMVDPEGETGMVPAHLVQQAFQAGYRQVQ